MTPIGYTRGLRRTALVSWLAALLVVLGLGVLGWLPLTPATPFLALLLGTPPIAVFMVRKVASCEHCGGPMRIASAYPRIVFRCRRCGSSSDTGIHPDF